MRRGSSASWRHGRQHGFTLVWLLAAMALVAAVLAQVGPMWSQQAQREREAELVRVGTLYAKALQSYRATSPGSVRKTPVTLQELLQDSRFVGTVRHLRKIYPDPFNADQPWGLLRNADGTIRGVYSQSDLAPFRTEAMQLPGLEPLAAARRYADWHFIPKLNDAAQ